MERKPPPLKKATNLDDVYWALRPDPLKPEELHEFYGNRINTVRGGDKLIEFKRGLNRAFGATYYQTYFMGHPGTGKSTEMTRLGEEIKDKFCVVRFSVKDELDPNHFKAFDLLLLMMYLLMERSAKQPDQGGVGLRLNEDLLQNLQSWFDSETTTFTGTTTASMGAEVGIKTENTVWDKLLGLLANFKAEMRFAGARDHKIIEYRLQRIETLIEKMNRLLDHCNERLKAKDGREWLFIVEDFDKPGISPAAIQELFVTYGNILPQLHVHLIFNIPSGLVYSSKAPSLYLRNTILPDTPVYTKEHLPHEEGRKALEEILVARADPELFAKGQMRRLVVASGGNLRDLFEMTTNSTETAAIRGSELVEEEDVHKAINERRVDYTRRLGTSEMDVQTVTYTDKMERLKSVYLQEYQTEVPDELTHLLLRTCAMQEFNGERWFGVHPLVVDVLIRHKVLPEGTLGGTL